MLESWWRIARVNLANRRSGFESCQSVVSLDKANYKPLYLSLFIQDLINRYRFLTARGRGGTLRWTSPIPIASPSGGFAARSDPLPFLITTIFDRKITTIDKWSFSNTLGTLHRKKRYKMWINHKTGTFPRLFESYEMSPLALLDLF